MFVENRFVALLSATEKLTGERPTYLEISQATGISTKTLTQLAKQRMQRYDMETTVAPLIAYFQSKGVPCNIGTFFSEGMDYPPLESGPQPRRVTYATV